MSITKLLSLVVIIVMTASSALAQNQLEAVYSSPLVINGPTTSPDGRLFTVAQPSKPGESPQVVEIRDGKAAPYPDERINSWRPGMDASHLFVGVNSLRFGPDGFLWAVDRGGRGIGKPLVPGGVKLMKINVSTNKVVRIYDLASMTRPWSFVDDVRFHGSIAYLTDAGSPGLIVLDLHSGHGRRVLDGHPSTVAQMPLIAEGKVLRDQQGKTVNIHADQLEVSPDGEWLYYQACSGSLWRIGTKFLDDSSLTDAQLSSHTQPYADTPSTGGTAIAANGTIYLSDVDKKRILTISPEGTISTLIKDPRLIWVDAMWIDDAGYLLMPASQLNRSAGLNNGVDAVRQPIVLYRLKIGQKGVR